MRTFHVEPLSRRIPIVKSHIWCIYEGTQPVFQGTINECRDWLDFQESIERLRTCTPSPPNRGPNCTDFVRRTVGFLFGSPRLVEKNEGRSGNAFVTEARVVHAGETEERSDVAS